MARRKFSDAASREAFWREHVTRWASSGESVIGYCKAEDLSEGSFHYWKSALKRRDGRPVAGDGPPAFAELRITARQDAFIEIAVGGGTRRVQVHPGFDEETLARVLGVLERMDGPETPLC